MRCRLYPSFCQVFILCCLCIVLLGCNQQEQTTTEQQPVTNHQTFRIGLIPELNIFDQKKRYQPLMAYLSEELGVNFEIVILPRYGNIIDNFNELGLDGAFMGSFTAALAIKKLGVEPIARPQFLGGASTYYGLVFVKKGSGIRTAENMRGKRMVLVDRATTAGFLLPLAYFKTLGIADYTTWFREFYFSGTHEDAIYDVMNDQADIGAAKNTVFYRLAATDNRLVEELEILATSPHVPSNGLVMRKDFPLALKNILRETLLSIHQKSKGQNLLEELKVEKFIETSVVDYQPVLDYAKKIGLELETYNYLNN